MAQLFADRLRAAATRRERARLWALGLGDVVRHAGAERARQLRTWIRSGRPARVPGHGPRRRIGLMDALGQDVRFGVRSLRKTPGTTAVVLVMLALGIGANTAIFSFTSAFLLRPLPVRDPGRLVAINGTTPETSWDTFSYPDYLAFRDRATGFDAIAAFGAIGVSLGTDDGAELVSGEIVSGNYFDALGVQPILGRAFLPDEDRTPGAPPVVVLSHGLWQRRFGGDPGVLGRPVSINGTAFTIIGIAPEAFAGVRRERPSRLWVPMTAQPLVRLPSPGLRRRLGGVDLLSQRRIHWVDLVGRLAPGVSREQAAAGLNDLLRRLALEFPDAYEETGAALFPAGAEPYVTGEVVPSLTVLMAVVGLVLLIACANVAGLQLSRAVSRRHEIALRMALGAGRARLVRQLLVENLLLAFAGAAGGVALAGLGAPLVAARFPLPGGVTPDIDGRVLAFTLALGFAAGLVAGMAPAGVASRFDIGRVLKDESAPAGGTRRRSVLRSGLVAAQMAISLVLLVGAVLFVRTLENARTTDPGFSVDGLVNLTVNAGVLRYDEARNGQLYAELLARLGGLPGVTAASAGRIVPLSGSARLGEARPEDAGRATDAPGLRLFLNTVAPDYFRTLEIPLMRGRDFGPDDRPGTTPVAIVNETAAAMLWPGADPIGRRVILPTGVTQEIVGVVKDSRYVSIREQPLAVAYVPLAQNPESSLTFHLRAAGDPGALAAAARAAVGALDPSLPVVDVRTMVDAAGDALMRERVLATGLSLFGALALLIAGVGLFGVTAHAVGQRTREIGVRVALGANPRQVLGLVMRQGLRVTMIGAGIGLVATLALGRLVASLLFGLTPSDPASLATALVALGGAALVASWLPARRATRVDPVRTLRTE